MPLKNKPWRRKLRTNLSNQSSYGTHTYTHTHTHTLTYIYIYIRERELKDIYTEKIKKYK